MENLTDKEWFNNLDTQAQGYAEKIKEIGEWYDKQETVLNTRTIGQWNALALESKRQAERLKKKYSVNVVFVSGQPYNTPEEMFYDIAKGILYISTDNTEHPVFSYNDTIIQRVWHDLTHYEHKTGFGFAGEVATCENQINHIADNNPLKADIAHALYVDIVGQVANGLIHKQFPIQKVF